MAFTLPNWSCVSNSLAQGQETVVPFGGSSTVLNSPNLFTYGSPTDDLAAIAAANYFLPQYASLSVGDVIIVNGTDGSNMYIVATSSATGVTVNSFTVSGSVATANIQNGAVTGIKLANPMVGSGSGFTFDDTTASATPGTIRALKGLMSGTNATMTSGNLVGVRGEVDLVGASGGFVYGTQGKVIPTGTLSGSVWVAPVFAQLDISGATVNAAQLAPVWADYGATSGTISDATGLRMFAGTNTTAATLNAHIYLYGKSSNLFELDLNGSTYVASGGSGVLSGTIKKIALTVDGVQYYIPAATVIS